MSRVSPNPDSEPILVSDTAPQVISYPASPRSPRQATSAIPTVPSRQFGNAESTFTTITIDTAKHVPEEPTNTVQEDVNPQLFISSVAAMFCCGVLGLLALAFSMRSMSANESRRPRAARFYAEKALAFAATSCFVGVFFYIVLTAAVVLIYYCYYHW